MANRTTNKPLWGGTFAWISEKHQDRKLRWGGRIGKQIKADKRLEGGEPVSIKRTKMLEGQRCNNRM